MEDKDAKLVAEAIDALFSCDAKRIDEMSDRLKKRNDELAAELEGDGMEKEAYTNEDMLSALRGYVVYRVEAKLVNEKDVSLVKTLLDYQTRTEEIASDERRTEVMCFGGGSHGD